MIYEYKCHDCGKINEFWMKISDPAPKECPECKGSQLERVISKTSFALKGSGWYTTDYKKPGSSTSSSTSSSTKSESDSSTSSGGSCCNGGGCSHKG